MKYIEKQISWFLIFFFTSMITLLILSYYYQWGDKPLDSTVFLIILSLLALCLLLFFKMQTIVDNDCIKIFFGIGLICKKINIKNIKHLEPVRNKWFYGWGIRMLKNGWLYNIKGLKAVELKFNDRKSVIRIGTKNPEKIISAIELCIETIKRKQKNKIIY